VKIRFKLFGEFRELVEEDEVMVDVPLGSRLREAFRAMIRRHPKLDGRILDEEGSLHTCALAFLNGRNTRTLEQSNPLLDEGDTVVLTSFVGGG
jgi:molybdopterin converting factor small subunit